jgi:hypothetical protein
MANKKFVAKNGVAVGTGHTVIDIVDQDGHITANTVTISGTVLNATAFAGTANNASYLEGSNGSYYTGYADNKAANAYSNSVSYTDNKAANAYTNATTFASNASNITTGTLTANVLATSGVTANTYGNSSSIPVITIDDKGRITSATTNAVAGVTGFTYTPSNSTFIITTGAGSTFPASITAANDSVAGIIKVVDSVSNVNIDVAASANSVKVAYDNAATAYSNAATYADNKAANAYSNAISYADNKAANAYSNATTFAANATNVSSGTLAEARLPYRMDQNVRTNDTVSFGGMTITGNLTVTGTTVTVNANNLSVQDNMIYLNNGSNSTNVDLGIAGNYNDGTYRHTGFFRDASDGVWKVYDQYLPEPDASPYIDTANASFRIADFQANVVTAASFSGNGASVTSVNAATVGGNTAGTLRSYSDSAAATAYSNATSYAATIAGTAYSNATSYAASIAGTAYSNATSYAASIAATAYSNAVSVSSSSAATAYSNAVSYFTTNYTASDVLTKIKTVDGSGSGLDADLLDGQNSSYFATASSLSSYLPLSGGTMTGSIVNNQDGAVVLESNLSEANNWLWKENAKAWGIFWLNKGSQGAATLGGYTTIGAETLFMGGNAAGPAMPSGWTGYASGSYINAMISNYNGYIYSGSTIYAASSMSVGGNTVWHAGNDGSGSGLDADLLDGYHASSLLPSAGADYVISTSPSTDYSNTLTYWQSSGLDTNYAPSTDWYNTIRGSHGGGVSYYSNTLAMKMTGSYVGTIWTQTRINGSLQGWNQFWHSNNDGSGSGLDADLLDGINSTSLLRALGSNDGMNFNTTVYNSMYYAYIASSANAPTAYSYPYGTILTFDPGVGSAGRAQFYVSHAGNDLCFRGGWNANDSWQAWNRVWTNVNDGSGSGLDADLLDGLNSSQFLRSDASTTNNTDIRAPIFYDSNNTAYYVDPASFTSLYGGMLMQGDHSTTQLKLRLPSSNNGAATGTVQLQAWCSEPGNSWDGAGFGYNVDNNTNESGNVPAYYFGRPNTSFGQAYMRMTSDGNWYFYNTPNGSNTRYTTMQLERTGSLRTGFIYDLNDTAYYLDPNGTSRIYEAIAINRLYVSSTSDVTINYDQIWRPNGTLHLQYSSGGNIDMNYGGGYTYSRTSLRAPIFYDYDDTGYYLDPNSTSNSALRIRGGALHGPNPTWSAYLYVGTDGRPSSDASVCVTNGNLHMDCRNGYAMYLNYYSTNNIYSWGNFGVGSDSASYRLHVHGTIYSTSNIIAASDAKLKENVSVIENAIDKVKQIRGVTYTRNDLEDKTKRHAGVIAQEVELVLPEVVDQDNEGIKNVAYGNMIGLLIEAIKEQQKQIDELKAALSNK